MTENNVNNNSDNDSDIRSGLLPNLCEVRNLFIVVLLTEVLAIIFAMAASSSSREFWDYLSVSSLLMLWIALLNAAALCLLRNWLHKYNKVYCLIITYCLLMSISILVAFLSSFAVKSLLFDYDTSTLSSLFYVRVITISAVIYFLLLRYFYIQHQWLSNQNAQNRAEIQALRARIRPHFLFNCMNTIASLIEVSPDKAERAVEDLSDLFRASLSEKNMCLLGDEIELTKSYLAIESLRMGDRLQTEWKIDQNLLNIEIPALSIQPLAENAIYHGIEPVPEGGKILISALQIGNKLKLSISNPLMPESLISKRQSSSFKKGNQMAQDNIRQRLKLVYGDDDGFEINDTKENYIVSLFIPLDVKHERFNS
jgi:two-component system sensor histidine kinase AlgZ